VRNKKYLAAFVGLSLAIGLSGCASQSEAAPLTVVVHDSVVITDAQLAEFKKETGIEVKLVKAGDAGAMTNKLILTKDQPIGDMFYGIDNTFIGAATSANIVGDYSAIDFGDVCFNYDKTWFTNHEQAAPETIQDLTKPEFKGLTVVENPSTSSTGLAFLIATVGTFGADKWTKYWEDLKANDVRIDAGWEEAYNVNFSGSAGKGNYPILLSYSSSPAFEENTASIDDGCFRQTEYAGLLTGGSQVEGARKFINFLLSDKFQKTIPDSMYMYPVSTKVALPEAWSTKAPAATNAVAVDSKTINANRSTWLKAWDAIFKN
jgi:thiamine transport system substrate-binding protein